MVSRCVNTSSKKRVETEKITDEKCGGELWSLCPIYVEWKWRSQEFNQNRKFEWKNVKYDQAQKQSVTRCSNPAPCILFGTLATTQASSMAERPAELL
jgi:hypothetical protein